MRHLLAVMAVGTTLAALLPRAAACRGRRRSRPAQRRLRARRRPRLGRARQLRPAEDPHALARPARRGGSALHAALRRQRGLRALAERPPDRAASRAHADPGQPRGPARGAGPAPRRRRHPRRALQEGGLRDRGDGEVGARPARLRGRPAQAGLRPLLRLQLPAPGPQLLPDLPLRRRPEAPARQPGVRVEPEARRRAPIRPIRGATRGTRARSTRRTSIWERARAFIRENKDRPFFLYLPTTVPHLALQVPEDSLAEYRGLWPDPPYPRRQRLPPAPLAARRLRGDGHPHGPRGRAHPRSRPRAGPRRAHDRRLHLRQRADLRPPGRLGLGVLPLRRPLPGAQGLPLRGRRPRARDRALDGTGAGRPGQRAGDRLRGLAADAARAGGGRARRLPPGSTA